MMTDFVPHRRQFVLSRRAFLQDGWREKPLPGGLILSHCPELTVHENAATGQIQLGQYWLNGTAGRHVTIDKGWLTLDFCGLASCYYATGPLGPVLSSSPALLREICGLTRNPRQLRWREINWYPAPGSTGMGMRQLMRDQAIRIDTHEIRHVPRDIPEMASTAKAAEALAEHLVETFRTLPDGRLRLGLTAGLDSRTLLAALIASGRSFETFTQNIRDYSQTDIRIAKALAARYGFTHRTIEPAPTAEPEIVAKWDAHCDGAYSDADNALLLPRGQYRFLDREDILIRGGCFEFGRMHCEARLGTQHLFTATPASVMRAFKGKPSEDATAYDAMADWLDWRRAHPYDLPFADAFFLDQDIGGWLRAIEQATDALPCLSVVPGSSEVVLSAVRTPASPTERKSGLVQRLAAQQMVPDILNLPVNPVPLSKMMKTAMRRTARDALLSIGLLRRSDLEGT